MSDAAKKKSIITDAMDRAEKLKNSMTSDNTDETTIDRKTAYKRAGIAIVALAGVAGAAVLAFKAAAKTQAIDETSSTTEETND